MSSLGAIDPYKPAPCTYEATMPKCMESSLLDRIWDIAYLILSALILPIGITRLIGYAMDRWMISPMIIPSIDAPFGERNLLNREAMIRDHKGKEVSFRSPDGILIDAFYIPGNQSTKCIIFFPGNKSQIEDYFDQIDKHPYFREIDILFVNPPGVGKSEGRPTPLNLKLAAYSAMAYVKEKLDRFPIPTGHSLGAAIGVAGAAIFQQEHPEIRVSVAPDRTFTNLQQAIATSLDGGCLGAIGRSLAWLNGWDISPLESARSLKGRIWTTYDDRDCVIKPAISFGKTFLEEHPPNLTAFELTCSSYPERAHGDPMSASAAEDLNKFLTSL